MCMQICTCSISHTNLHIRTNTYMCLHAHTCEGNRSSSFCSANAVAHAQSTRGDWGGDSHAAAAAAAAAAAPSAALTSLMRGTSRSCCNTVCTRNK